MTHRRILHAARLVGAAGALAAFAALVPTAAGAQERLVRFRTLGAGFTVERYDFGADGLPQGAGGAGGGPATRVLDATQWSLPVAVSVPLSAAWVVDVGAALTNGEVTLADDATGAEESATLSGVSDVRLRATGRLLGDAVVLTVGANLPSGRSSLDAGQVAALGVLAAPALGAAVPAVSFGPSATTGVVLSREAGGWAWAGGLSFEVRGDFSPVAALTAGVPSPEFDPGNAVHLSLGGDGFLGESALTVSATADVYTQDRLVGGGGAGQATVQLGPTFGVEAQLRPAAPRFRELVLYVSERYRAAFERDGERVPGTSANYLSAGARGALPVGRRTDVTAALDVWHHGGLTVDNTLVTAETLSGAVTLGLVHRLGPSGRLSLQPFVRARAGSVDTGAGSGNVTGLSAGVTLGTRF